MAVLVMFDSPARRTDAEAITDSMNVRDDPPNGLIFHVITEVPQGVRVYDVWESEADFQQFARGRLLPAGRAYSLERGLPMDAPMPPLTVIEAFDLVRGTNPRVGQR